MYCRGFHWMSLSYLEWTSNIVFQALQEGILRSQRLKHIEERRYSQQPF